MDEHIGPIIPADKAEALCVIEPFYFSFYSRHVPYSRRPSALEQTCASDRLFLLLVLPLLLGEMMPPELLPPPWLHPYTRYFGFRFILRFATSQCQLI